jgi:hypothetical protein
MRNGAWGDSRVPTTLFIFCTLLVADRQPNRTTELIHIPYEGDQDIVYGITEHEEVLYECFGADWTRLVSIGTPMHARNILTKCQLSITSIQFPTPSPTAIIIFGLHVLPGDVRINVMLLFLMWVIFINLSFSKYFSSSNTDVVPQFTPEEFR